MVRYEVRALPMVRDASERRSVVLVAQDTGAGGVSWA